MHMRGCVHDGKSRFSDLVCACCVRTTGGTVLQKPTEKVGLVNVGHRASPRRAKRRIFPVHLPDRRVVEVIPSTAEQGA